MTTRKKIYEKKDPSDTWNRSRDTRGLGINDAQSINKDKEEAIFGFYRSPDNIDTYVCTEEGCISGEKDGATVLGYRNDENDPVFISLLSLGGDMKCNT